MSTQQIYTILLELKTSLSVDTRFTFFQDPVRVEDALGRVFPFPSECSIEALHAEIKARFREGPGELEVMLGKFEIFDARNTDQSITRSGHNVLLPGMFVNMALVFETTITKSMGIQCPMSQCGSSLCMNAVGLTVIW